MANLQILFIFSCLKIIFLAMQTSARSAGSIKITSSAGFATFFYVDFVQNGTVKNVTTYETSTFISGFSRSLEIPEGATEIRLRVEYIFFIGVYREAFRLHWTTPPNSCFEIWGTTTNTRWQEVACSGISWDGNVGKNCDWPGNHLASMQTKSQDCYDKCLETDGCTHYTWNNVNGGTCMMKQGSVCKTNAFYRADSNCGIIESCDSDNYPIKWYNGWANNCDFPGNNLTYTFDRGQDCTARCRQIKGCTHFSYDGQICWMKQGEACKRDMVYNRKKGTVCGILEPCRTELW